MDRGYDGQPPPPQMYYGMPPPAYAMKTEADYPQARNLIIIVVILLIAPIVIIVGGIIIAPHVFFNDCLIRLIGFVFNIIITVIIYTDAKKIGAGTAYPAQKFFKAATWHASSWAILAFFFGFILLIIYFVCRKDVFIKNNVYIDPSLT